MTGWNGLSRRMTLKGSLLLPLTAGMTFAGGSAGAQGASPNARALVAYFSRSGNTRVIAGQIGRARSADVFEIEPAEPYPADYDETVRQAKRETETDYEPPLRGSVRDIGSYDVVFLGFPIWGMTAPPVIRSFLSAHDLSGRTIVPFVTHGGYGLGRSLSVVAEHARQARIVEGFTKQSEQERETLSQVTRWLGEVRLE
ncbi:flavodoxin [Neorhizobium galegae]|uniref:Flavodoxin n=1 Tax=Neorhizobium galegae bv. orientalis str. HAMBI 540 TaxID=1028800 RepID=A0A068SUM9_NEOGA|nr:flavodoxin [Neorhizobium galegae]CDN48790.1 Flavodoxin [Neorhizobium galegae bv. orientalis str. HAMBI 540]